VRQCKTQTHFFHLGTSPHYIRQLRPEGSSEAALAVEGAERGAAGIGLAEPELLGRVYGEPVRRSPPRPLLLELLVVVVRHPTLTLTPRGLVALLLAAASLDLLLGLLPLAPLGLSLLPLRRLPLLARLGGAEDLVDLVPRLLLIRFLVRRRLLRLVLGGLRGLGFLVGGGGLGVDRGVGGRRLPLLVGFGGHRRIQTQGEFAAAAGAYEDGDDGEKGLQTGKPVQPCRAAADKGSGSWAEPSLGCFLG